MDYEETGTEVMTLNEVMKNKRQTEKWWAFCNESEWFDTCGKKYKRVSLNCL